MVKGKLIRGSIDRPVVNYRKIDALNRSMIQLFDENPVQFFREYKLGEPTKPKESLALIIGDVVDFYLLACKGDEEVFQNRFDEKYVLMDQPKGGGQAFELADELFKITVRDTYKDGNVTTSFEDRFDEALMILKGKDKYKGKGLGEALIDFNSKSKSYFDLKIASVGKIVVDQSIIEKSRKVAHLLKDDEFTREVFVEDDKEMLTHFPIQWRYVLTSGSYVDCKAELDLMKIDHRNKVIYIYDLKTNYDNENFQYSYIKNYYYLQNAFYTLAVMAWMKDTDLKDYFLEPMRFVVGDTSVNNRRPLVYQTDTVDFNNGRLGFSLRGTWYRGIEELINEIAWCEEKGIWNCNKESYDNKGKMKLNIQYDE